MKAFPADPSPFLVHGRQLQKTDAAKSPFLHEWVNQDTKAWKEAEKRPHVHITPVSMEHLRPMTRTLSKIEVREKSRQKNVRRLAGYFHEELVKAFKNAPEERRERILRATVEVVRTRGFAGTRVSDIAAAAGTSQGLILYHFQSLAGALGAVQSRPLAEQCCALETALAESPLDAALADKLGGVLDRLSAILDALA